ncbi:pyridoxamine 5'-phosphate oxidase family protein [Streptomyces sp. NPDC002138]|uniref:pyridoxamine 5'-phosphate oxidase family protein n=1 Tax=Streptomyces sp. NPDC002138 TaxID=3154410 RepID=UPI003322DBA7
MGRLATVDAAGQPQANPVGFFPQEDGTVLVGGPRRTPHAGEAGRSGRGRLALRGRLKRRRGWQYGGTPRTPTRPGAPAHPAHWRS